MPKRPKVYAPLTIVAVILFDIATRFLAWYITRQVGGLFGLYYAAIQLAVVLLAGRWIAIYIVMLYQHYAPMHIRMRCHCTPSCSDYAKESLRVYGLFKGAWLAYRRVRYTCDGSDKSDPVPQPT